MHDAAVADEFGDLDGGDVERIGERVAHGDATHESFAVVIRRVFLAVEFEGGGLVVDGRGWSDDRLHAINGVVERRGIDERFEDRTGLAVGQGVIELALPVVASTNHGFDLAGSRIQGDQRDLRLRNWLVASLLGQIFLPLVVLLLQEQVHILHSGVDSGGGGTLQSGVQRRVDAEILAQQFVLGIFVEQVVFHHVDEIGRFTSRNRSADNLQGRALGILKVLVIDVLVVEQLRQDAVARLHTALRMAVGGGVVIRRANDAGKVSTLGERQLPQIFSEVGHAGFGKSANAKTSAVAQVDFIGVQLEDLLLVEALLEFDGNHGFGQLAAPGTIGREEEGARHLHGDGAGALVVRTGMPYVGPRRSHDADEIKAAMLEETLVLSGKNGVHQHYRQIFIADGTALLASAIEKIGDEFRFDLRGVQLSATGKRLDGTNTFPAELNRERIAAGEIGKL